MMPSILCFVLVSWGRVPVLWGSRGFLSVFSILGPVHISFLSRVYPVLSEIVCRCCLNWSTFLSEFLNVFFVLSSRSFVSPVSLLAWYCLGRCSFIWFKWVLSIMAGTAISSGPSFLARFGFASSCPCLFIARFVCSRFWLSLKKT